MSHYHELSTNWHETKGQMATRNLSIQVAGLDELRVHVAVIQVLWKPLMKAIRSYKGFFQPLLITASNRGKIDDCSLAHLRR